MGIIKRVVDLCRTVKLHYFKPLHIELNLSDHCNLNCASCSHYSPLAKAEFITLEALEHTMKRISAVKDRELIESVYLMGGETLLYPNIKEAVEMARRYFPWANIEVFTNGLMVPKMGDDFWEAMRENDATLTMTIYPVKFDYETAQRIVEEKGVRLSIFSMRTTPTPFVKMSLDPQKGQRRWLNHLRCVANGCITVDNGRIFPCAQSACIGNLNRQFNTDFRWEKGDYIEVDKLRSAKELRRFMRRSLPFCGYCGKRQDIAYSPSRRDLSEWQ